MCGRFRLLDEDEEAEEILEILAEMNQRYRGSEALTRMARGDVFPGSIVPVIANSRRMTPRPFLMQWGFQRAGGKGRIINARSETAMTLPLFEASMRTRRCLIPANGYYEWERRDGQKIQYAIRPQEERMMYLAGLYRLEDDSQLPAFTVLTREAAPQLRFIHPRMPVIVPRERAEEWLSPQGDAQRVMESGKAILLVPRAVEKQERTTPSP